MSMDLAAQHRSVIRQSVLSAVACASPGCFSQYPLPRPGGVQEIEKNLDALIEIVRRTTASTIEPFTMQVLEQVCAHCSNQRANLNCELRSTQRCLLYKHLVSIVAAIANALTEIGDEQYIQAHLPPDLPVLCSRWS